MSKSAIAIKGTKGGLQIILSEAAPFDEILRQLTSRLRTTETFFHGARVALDVGERAVSLEEWSRLEAELRTNGLTLTAALAAREDSRLAARSLGIPLVTESRREATFPGERPRALGVEAPSGSSESLLVKHTLRSGQVVRYPGAVVIVGDVNPGAEVLAGGDVIVWGSLRGLVHAGASGDETAAVSALVLAPTQLRIAGHIARAPATRPRLMDVPETARLHDGRIVVEEWSRVQRPVNLRLHTLLFLALVYALEAIALAVVLTLFPSLSLFLTVLIVIVAIVLGWLVALATANRQSAA